MTVTHGYEKDIARTVTEFKRIAFDHKGWTLKKDTPDIKIYSTDARGEKWPCFKGEATIHMPAERIMDMVHPTWRYREIFDPNFSHAQILQMLDEETGTAIIRQFFKPALLGILSPRDSIDIFQFYKTNEIQYSCLSSIDYPTVKKDRNYVRGFAWPMGIAAVQTSDPQTSRVVAISHMDFKPPSLLPQSVVESVIPTNFIQYFSALKKMEFEPYERLGKDKPLCKWRD